MSVQLAELVERLLSQLAALPRGDGLLVSAKVNLPLRNTVPLCRTHHQGLHRHATNGHHLKFAQPKALSRKVSDEYIVPLCRAHHQELHRQSNERTGWANLKIEPLRVAHDLWSASPIDSPLGTAVVNAAAPHERAIPNAHELAATYAYDEGRLIDACARARRSVG